MRRAHFLDIRCGNTFIIYVVLFRKSAYPYWRALFIIGDDMKIDEKKRDKLKKKTEKLSAADLRELMGVDRPVYTRHKGAIRRK